MPPGGWYMAPKIGVGPQQLGRVLDADGQALSEQGLTPDHPVEPGEDPLPVAIELLAAAQGVEFHHPQQSSPAIEKIIATLREVHFQCLFFERGMTGKPAGKRLI